MDEDKHGMKEREVEEEDDDNGNGLSPDYGDDCSDDDDHDEDPSVSWASNTIATSLGEQRLGRTEEEESLLKQLMECEDSLGRYV